MVSPDEPEQCLDEALEAMFDAPTPPSEQPTEQHPPSSPKTPPRNAPPAEIPATPEPSPQKPQQKSILEHLAENSNRLTAGAARVAEDFRKLAGNLSNDNLSNDNLSNENPNPGVSRSGPNEVKKPSTAELLAARRKSRKRQPTKDAFMVIGRGRSNEGSVHATKTFAYVDNRITNMSLKEAPYEKERLAAIFEHTPRLDIADIKARYEDLHTGALKDYTMFACLVKKVFKKQAKNGTMYAMWELCNMPRGNYDGKDVLPTTVRLLVFDTAYESFHTTCEGTVFALRRPSILPRREGEKEGVSHALRISKKENVAVLGVCKDFRLCESKRHGGELCGQWYHAHHLTSCPKHAKKRLRGLTTGSRMDIQNAVRPYVRDPSRRIRIPMNISTVGGETENEGEMDKAGSAALVRKRIEDSQRAREIKKRGAENRLERTNGAAGSYLASVPGGMKNKIPRLDPIASVARGSFQTRGRLGERHNRLLGRSDRQARYYEACESLYSLGFKLRADGGWDPPAECDVTVVTNDTHTFSGLGKLQRRRFDRLGDSKGSGNVSKDARKHGSENINSSANKSAQGGTISETRAEEEIKGNVADGSVEDKEKFGGEQRLKQETAANGESMKMETDDRDSVDDTEANKPVAQQQLSEAATAATSDEKASTDLGEEIVLSDETDED